jgi:hypothetical protein
MHGLTRFLLDRPNGFSLARRVRDCAGSRAVRLGGATTFGSLGAAELYECFAAQHEVPEGRRLFRPAL